MADLWATLWSDGFDYTYGVDWTRSPSTYISWGYMDGYAAVQWGGPSYGGDQYMYRETDVSGYDELRLSYDVGISYLEEDAANECNVYFAFDEMVNRQLLRSYHNDASDTELRQSAVIPLPTGSYTKLFIWFEADGNDDYDSYFNSDWDDCYWDNVKLEYALDSTAPSSVTSGPSNAPSSSASPTNAPSTGSPTATPSTGSPTTVPSTGAPATGAPSAVPSTGAPSNVPSTGAPSVSPSVAPSVSPSVAPSAAPSRDPSLSPSKFPSKAPSDESASTTEMTTTQSPTEKELIQTEIETTQQETTVVAVAGGDSGLTAGGSSTSGSITVVVIVLIVCCVAAAALLFLWWRRKQKGNGYQPESQMRNNEDPGSPDSQRAQPGGSELIAEGGAAAATQEKSKKKEGQDISLAVVSGDKKQKVKDDDALAGDEPALPKEADAEEDAAPPAYQVDDAGPGDELVEGGGDARANDGE